MAGWPAQSLFSFPPQQRRLTSMAKKKKSIQKTIRVRSRCRFPRKAGRTDKHLPEQHRQHRQQAKQKRHIGDVRRKEPKSIRVDGQHIRTHVRTHARTYALATLRLPVKMQHPAVVSRTCVVGHNHQPPPRLNNLPKRIKHKHKTINPLRPFFRPAGSAEIGRRGG